MIVNDQQKAAGLCRQKRKNDFHTDKCVDLPTVTVPLVLTIRDYLYREGDVIDRSDSVIQVSSHGIYHEK